MDGERDNISLTRENSEVERLRGELEQARVALEDMDQRIVELSVMNADLQERLEREARRHQATEAELKQLRASKSVAASEPGGELVLREQLGTALEELHVMAEELSLAQDALRQATNPH